MSKNLVLIGGGGHCESCIDVIEEQGIYKIAGIVDLSEKIGDTIAGYKIIAADEDLVELIKDYDFFLITMGQIKDPSRRVKMFDLLKKYHARLPVIISPFAHVSKRAKIGEGSVVHHFAMVNTGAWVGDNCIINTRALVEHHAKINDHCHVATGAVINGGVQVGEKSFIGSQSVCREMIEIGQGSIIGAGMRVMESI